MNFTRLILKYKVDSLFDKVTENGYELFSNGIKKLNNNEENIKDGVIYYTPYKSSLTSFLISKDEFIRTKSTDSVIHVNILEVEKHSSLFINCEDNKLKKNRIGFFKSIKLFM